MIKNNNGKCGKRLNKKRKHQNEVVYGENKGTEKRVE